MKLCYTIITLATVLWLMGCGGSKPIPPTPETFANLSGANLPWEGYGHDVGVAHTWVGSPDGFSVNQAKLHADMAFLSQNECKLMRVFIFCDLRGGVIFDLDGKPQFDNYVLADFQTLIGEASINNLRLIPVLFDFTIADGVSNEGATNVGEHPEMITDSSKRAALINLLRTFIQKFGDDPTIFAWEVINEPEFASAVSNPDMEVFVQEMVAMIHQAAPGAKVTLGCRNRGDLANWKNVGLDIYQFHYYDQMENQYPLDYPAADLGLEKPVLAGELQPTNIANKLTSLQNNGYAGALFWSLNADFDFRAVADEYKQWMLTH